MKRLKDWRARLSDEIERHRRMPYDEAQNNCGLFAADCIKAMTGVDLAESLRARFSTLDEALALLRDMGHPDLCAFAAAHLQEVHPVFARAGDVMAFRSEPTGWALGIVSGERVTVQRPDGLGTLPRSAAEKAFRVP